MIKPPDRARRPADIDIPATHTNDVGRCRTYARKGRALVIVPSQHRPGTRSHFLEHSFSITG
jgi:hypothetical protein